MRASARAFVEAPDAACSSRRTSFVNAVWAASAMSAADSATASAARTSAALPTVSRSL